jgi:aerotolerance regulator-like protein/VWA domain-containing protein/glycosyl hydrolase family 42 (putative beta-galactosidase)
MFELLHGWLGLGAIGGAIPVIIHLLNRRRFKIVRWAAMEFLLASMRKNHRRIRMENLLLLLLRVLMIILMALALARPRVVETGLMGALGTESRHAIIVLDQSLSMQYRDGQNAVFKKAKGVAQAVLESLNQGDVASLLVMSDETRPVVKEATLDIQLVKEEVKRLKPGWGATDARKALIAAAELIDVTRKTDRDVYIITDMQSGAWGKATDEPSAELKAALERLKTDAKVFVVDVGVEGADNIAVTAVRPLSKIVGTGTPMTFEIDVTNFGRAMKAGVTVNFAADKFSQDNKTLDIGPGKTETATFSHTFRTEGAHLVQAQLAEDRLSADNVRHLALNAEKSVPVLLVNGETATAVEENETYYIERALSPPTAEGAPRYSHIEPKVITEFGVSAADFERYRLVVLANLASLASENAVPRLEDYVRRGGALVVFLGDRVDSVFYNQQLYKNGTGLLPARLGREMGRLGDDKKGVTIELTKPVYPALQFFTGDKAILINPMVLLYKYFELVPPQQTENIRTVATVDGGGPAIMEKTYGRGKVVLFATSADTEWNNFGRVGSLLVVMHELVSYLAAGDLWDRNLQVGQPYRRTFAPELLIDKVTIRPPGAGSAPAVLKPYLIYSKPAKRSTGAAPPTSELQPVATEIVYNETSTAGTYELELTRQDGSRPPMEYVAVNPPPAESDLTRCTAADVRRRVKGLDFKYAADVRELKLAVAQSRSGKELARALLIALLAVACVELILGQRFGR